MSRSAPVVLIVDDSQTARVAATSALRAEGFSVVVLAGAAGAVESARFWLPDVILLDVVMDRDSASDLARGTGGGGFQVLGRLRADAATRRIPIVMWTTTPHERTERAAIERGAVALVEKSVGFERVALVLRQAIRTPRAPPGT